MSQINKDPQKSDQVNTEDSNFNQPYTCVRFFQTRERDGCCLYPRSKRRADCPGRCVYYIQGFPLIEVPAHIYITCFYLDRQQDGFCCHKNQGDTVNCQDCSHFVSLSDLCPDCARPPELLS